MPLSVDNIRNDDMTKHSKPSLATDSSKVIYDLFIIIFWNLFT